MPERPTGWFRWLGLSAAVLAIDLATKAWASAALASGEPVRVTGFFNLVLVHNTGAAFSFLANAGGWQRWFFVGVTIAVSAVLLWLLRRDAANRLLAMAYALVLGGALGVPPDDAALRALSGGELGLQAGQFLLKGTGIFLDLGYALGGFRRLCLDFGGHRIEQRLLMLHPRHGNVAADGFDTPHAGGDASLHDHL